MWAFCFYLRQSNSADPIWIYNRNERVSLGGLNLLNNTSKVFLKNMWNRLMNLNSYFGNFSVSKASGGINNDIRLNIFNVFFFISVA